MLRKYVSLKNATTPMEVIKEVRLHLKQFEKLSHECAPLVTISLDYYSNRESRT